MIAVIRRAAAAWTLRDFFLWEPHHALAFLTNSLPLYNLIGKIQINMESIMITALSHSPPPHPTGAIEGALRQAAQELEVSFLAEMLKSAGFGKPRESFGGGAGEDQFASFLRREHARAMVQAGGIGLTESFYQALVERADEHVGSAKDL
ncbi:rod-binding protein [Shimia sp. W99]